MQENTFSLAQTGGGTAARWLLLALQLPAQPSNARVKTWRRLLQLGAITLKNSVYVLPNSAQALEDFEWLRSEIAALKGQATIFVASSVDGVDDRAIEEEFRSARAADFKQLLGEIRRTQKRQKVGAGRDGDLARELRQLRDRLATLQGIDFFAAPGREQAEEELLAMERSIQRVAPRPAIDSSHAIEPGDYKHKVWVTRPRPGVDRFASAWLISRFIDPKATFKFAADGRAARGMVPFDMYDTGFRHEGNLCTFEVLQARFGIKDSTVRRLGEIVHDLDLKEERFRAPQTAAIGPLVEGLRRTFSDDSELLQQGILLFEALYQGLKPPAGGKSSTRARGAKGTT